LAAHRLLQASNAAAQMEPAIRKEADDRTLRIAARTAQGERRSNTHHLTLVGWMTRNNVGLPEAVATARTFLNVKMNCIALMGGQAHPTMMSAEMTQHHTCPLLDAAWQALERAKIHDDCALRFASLRVIDALLQQVPPDRRDLTLCGLAEDQ
jgi:hypothetical protein